MVFCPNCLTQIEEKLAACPACGQEFCLSCFAPLPAEATSCADCGAEAMMVCMGCQGSISRSSAFCKECGQAITATGPILVPEYTRIRKETDPGQDEPFTGVCPSCGDDLYIQDGFCSQCGQALCTVCGHGLEDDDDQCPSCGVALFFACPICHFELTAGTEMCPNCDALFPAVCSHCGGEVQPTEDRCPACRRPLTIQPRQSARTIRTFLVGKQLIRMIACPGCGRHTNPAAGPCTKCGTRVCAECQLILLADEMTCPRCGQKVATTVSPGIGRHDAYH